MITDAQLRQAESNGHSLFGASGWKRKLLCPGSLLAEIGLPDTSGYEAAEGSVYHWYAENRLREALFGKLFVDLPKPGDVMTFGKFAVPFTPANMEFAEQYVQWCFEQPGVHVVEQLVDLSPWTPIPKQKGSVDHAALRMHHATISDLKFGTGVKVFAHRNVQAAGYALGLIREWDFLFEFRTVTIRICQPRLDHFDVWETTVEELKALGEEVKAGLARCWMPDAPRTPGEEACRFCRARTTCPAVVALAERLLDGVFEDETIPADQLIQAVDDLSHAGIWIKPIVPSLTTAQLEQWLEYRGLLEDTLRDVHAELNRRLLAGEKLEKWGMYEGSKSRSIRDKSGVIKFALKHGIDTEKLWKVEFLSPAKLEELTVAELKVKKKAVVEMLEPFIDEVPGKPVMALKTSGKKQALNLADASFIDETL